MTTKLTLTVDDSVIEAAKKYAKKLDALVTRNTKDFKKADIAIVTPQEALALLNLKNK